MSLSLVGEVVRRRRLTNTGTGTVLSVSSIREGRSARQPSDQDHEKPRESSLDSRMSVSGRPEADGCPGATAVYLCT